MHLKYLVAYTIFWGIGPSQFKTRYQHCADDKSLENCLRRLRNHHGVYWINVFEWKECIEVKKKED